MGDKLVTFRGVKGNETMKGRGKEDCKKISKGLQCEGMMLGQCEVTMLGQIMEWEISYAAFRGVNGN